MLFFFSPQHLLYSLTSTTGAMNGIPVSYTRPEKVMEFLKRVLSGYEAQITAEIISDDGGRDVYEIGGAKGNIVLKGNSINTLAAALGDYLRHDAEVNLSWCGSRTDLPVLLPAPVQRRKVIEQKYRAYLNYCTFNYSASWWDWERWEKELDFMALNGINFPPAAVGIECVWYETLREIGFSESETMADFETEWLHTKKSFEEYDLDFDSTIHQLFNKYYDLI